MIGNDIVDLHASRQESNWQRKGWLQKLFAPEEQAIIQQSGDQESMVWLLWTMKEAAYKIFNRHQPEPFYAPDAFCCTLTDASPNTATGMVTYKQFVYDTKSTFEEHYIHTVAIAANTRPSIHISITDNNGSLAIPANLKLHKNEHSIPYLQHTINSNTFDASLSHHGSYLALAYLQ